MIVVTQLCVRTHNYTPKRVNFTVCEKKGVKTKLDGGKHRWSLDDLDTLCVRAMMP